MSGITASPIAAAAAAASLSMKSELEKEMPTLDEDKAIDIINTFCKRITHSYQMANTYREKRALEKEKAHPIAKRFIVIHCPNELYPFLADQFKRWKHALSSFEKESKLTSEDESKIDDSKLILDLLSQELFDATKAPKRSTYYCPYFLLCLSEDRTLHAVAQISQEFDKDEPIRGYKIDLLLTSPDNLRLSFQSGGVKGAASALIEEVAYKALQYCRTPTLFLNPIPNSVSFYEKLGCDLIPRRTSRVTAVLSGHKLLKFLNTFGGTRKTTVIVPKS